jgi:23S rRNA (guanosine2251-2'-O)-methyltransferase
MCIPKSSKNKEYAEMFINFMCEPRVSAENCGYIGYSTPISAAKDLMDEEIVSNEIAYPSSEILANSETFRNLSNETNKLLDDLWIEVRIGTITAGFWIAVGFLSMGVIALCAAAEYATVDDILRVAEEKGEMPFIVILDKIADPRNLGAIIRTANCAGVHGVIISKHDSATLTASCAKASAGAVEYTPVARVANLAKTIDDLKKKNIWVTGADASGDKELFDADLKGAVAIVIGSEGEGISRLVLEKCDFKVKIPMKGDVNSLNASVAAALFIYEAVRQNRK